MSAIEEWIEKELDAGYSSEQIKQTLIKNGYDTKSIDDILSKSLIKRQANKELMVNSNKGKMVLVVVIAFIAGIVMTFYYLQFYDGPKQLKYEDVITKNPKLTAYVKSQQCREKFGFVFYSPDSRVSLLTFNGEVIGIVMVWPASEGWNTYADQPQENPINARNSLVYTQTIYFKTPPTAVDCAVAKS